MSKGRFYEHDDFEREHELRIRLIDIGCYEIRRKIKDPRETLGKAVNDPPRRMVVGDT